MNAGDAQNLIKIHNLIDKKTSRKVLNAIVFDHALDLREIDDERINCCLADLRESYWMIRSNLPPDSIRNLPFYQMITRRYPSFSWTPTVGGIEFNVRFAGIKPSLLSLLTGAVPEGSLCGTQIDVSLPGLDKEIEREISELFKAVGMVKLSQLQAARFAKWLRRGLNSERLTIISPVCPDYEIEDGTDAAHRFTFKGVGSGIGVTARRLFEALPAISELLCKRLGITFTHYVCPGDFEGFSIATNVRLGIDEATFLKKLEGSRHAISACAPTSVETCFFTAFCGGKNGWFNIYDEIFEKMMTGAFGPIVGEPWLREIALGRRGLYDRWYDVMNQPASFYEGIAVRQGAEYATMGTIIASSPDCPNPLVLGADDHKMSRFYGIASTLPVLYLQRNYE